MNRFCTSIVSAAALALASAQAADWPTYRGDYSRSGVSTQSLAGTPVVSWTWQSQHPPQPAWQGEAKWDGWNKVFDMKPRQAFDRAFHVVVSGRRAYFGSSADDQVRCLDTRSGKVLWSFFSEGPVRLAPTLHEGRLYFGSDDGCVYCLQADDGRLIWKTRAVPTDRRIPGNSRIISAWPVRTSVVVQDGKVYVTAGMFPADGVHLVALDAGTDQLAERLRMDDRVVSWEQQNIRTASDNLLGEKVSLVVVDVSFISLKLILPELKRFTTPGADIIALVKPQFEVGPAGLNKHGVVKSEKLQQFALRVVNAEAERLGYRVAEPIESPVKGGDGNTEYLIYLK
jgi:hypothetical protein